MGYLRAKDTVNGALGTCFAIIDGKRHELMQVKNIQAKVKKTRMTIPILGMTAKQQKSGGWEGTGTMTVYYVSSLFRRVMADYMKNGVDTYFELLLTNEDPTGDAGRQTVLLKDVNIEEMLIGKIDVEEAAMEEEMKFTFGGVELLDKFNQMQEILKNGRGYFGTGMLLQREQAGQSGGGNSSDRAIG